ncbi:hypothetical protein FGA82_31220 [Pseudomonas fluorescens]|uniref:hypothetical protein n=1 Tax=Pseudomonas fluorescens TaxID=294 RepID=UPI0011317022|nr:hypothetical protein [Pseudomonas fluorescens]TMU66284.1 hypothetical protein FGA82_31220 [Pseudomonas fluorescens]
MRPEHCDLDTPLFLPVSEETITAIIAHDQPMLLDNLSSPELAAILVIQNIPSLDETVNPRNASETILKKLIAWELENKANTNNQRLLSETKRLFKKNELINGYKNLAKSKISLLPPTLVIDAPFLLSNGEWDIKFRSEYFRVINSYQNHLETPKKRELWLSNSQNMIIRTFQANLNEHLHVQGYAGIGKSFLITSLLNYLDQNKTLILAKNTEKTEEIRKRSKIKTSKLLTFESLAITLLSKVIDRAILRRAHEIKPIQNLEIAAKLSLTSVQSLEISQVVSICLTTINNYCTSKDYTIREAHLPTLPARFSTTDRSVILEFSSRIWQAIDPTLNTPIKLPFYGLRTLKKASLLGLTIPSTISHILIDESHDLPPSLLKILESSPQSLITFGDEYQRLSGSATKRSIDIRQKEAIQSVRSGIKIERMLNPLIEAHPDKLKLPFEAAKDKDIYIHKYDQYNLPLPPTTILFLDHWGMLCFFINITTKGKHISFTSNRSKKSFQDFANDSLRLLRDNLPSTHLDLIQFASNRELYEKLNKHQEFIEIMKKTNSGYNVSDLNEGLTKISNQTSSTYTLALVSEVGNMEFNSVTISPNLMPISPPDDAYAIDNIISSLYTAISRAKREIYIQVDIDDWLTSYRKQGAFIYKNKTLLE